MKCGVKPRSRGVTRPAHITEIRLSHSQKEAAKRKGRKDPRVKYLVKASAVATILKSMAVKQLSRSGELSKNRIRLFLQNDENVKVAIQK